MNVTVIVATYGGGQWCERGDLAEQRVDDVHGAYLQANGGMTLRYHRDDARLHEVRNAAAYDARTDWLCFLDADDELEAEYFDAMDDVVDARHGFRLASRVLLAPAVRYVHADGRAEEPRIPNAEPRRPLHEVNTAVIGTLVQREVFDEVGGFRDWACYEDWDLWLRCTLHGADLLHVPEAIYRAHRPARRRESRNLPSRTVREHVYHTVRKELGYE